MAVRRTSSAPRHGGGIRSAATTASTAASLSCRPAPESAIGKQSLAASDLQIERTDRRSANRRCGAVATSGENSSVPLVRVTGISGAGKSTVRRCLAERGIRAGRR